MSILKITCPVPTARSERYRAEGWWDNRCLADGIETAALRRPDALAVADNNRDLTYSQLVRAVDAGVANLAAQGVGAGDGIVLVAGNTVESLVAYHSIVRVGAAAVVLDRRCGRADIRFAVDLLEPGASVIMPENESERLLGGTETPSLPIEVFGEIPPPAAGSRWSEPSRDSPAVVLFTSGTTGRPKAVVHSLNTLTAGAANMARITAAREDSVLFLVSPLTSIAGIMQMHLAADYHSAIVLEDRFDPEQSLDRINRAKATILGGAPVIAERLLRAASGRHSPHIALRILALGGAMLPRPLLEQATSGFGIEIARVYGSSEAPNFSGSVPEDDPVQRLSDDGALMPGSEVTIRASDGRPEGILRGPGLFLGYADNRDNVESYEDGWFRTGDLVEVNGGRLTVLGRLRDVVNRNGLKISLNEIDDALAGLPGVREQASFAMPDPDTGEHLAVAVVPEEGVKVTLDRVVAHLLALGIAVRKLPEELVLWEGPLPRTESGKVIRSRLVMDSPARTPRLPL
jgi:acyl-CoA synthetase (AMP-forming)/AMP-acid ligase II